MLGILSSLRRRPKAKDVRTGTPVRWIIPVWSCRREPTIRQCCNHNNSRRWFIISPDAGLRDDGIRLPSAAGPATTTTRHALRSLPHIRQVQQTPPLTGGGVAMDQTGQFYLHEISPSSRRTWGQPQPISPPPLPSSMAYRSDDLSGYGMPQQQQRRAQWGTPQPVFRFFLRQLRNKFQKMHWPSTHARHVPFASRGCALNPSTGIG